jgi:CubicO group peptidase (beta-lactamase class C family)
MPSLPACRAILLAAAVLFSPVFAKASDRAWNPGAAAHYSRRTGGTVLIIHREGLPAREDYAKGFSSRTALPVLSITKSIVALACLSASGLRLSDDIGPGGNRAGITTRHLLSQTSGIATGARRLYSKSVADVRKSVLSLKQEFPPGTEFSYGPSHYELLGAYSDRFAFHRPPVIARLLNRIGIEPADWRTDRTGNQFLSSGAVLTPAALMRLGIFVLERGRIFGFWPLVPPSQFHEAMRGTEANPCYGLGFWLNKTAQTGGARERDIEEAIDARLTKEEWHASCISQAAPRDLVCMVGSGGQRVYIIFSLHAVIVRMGRSGGFRDPEFLGALFSKEAG